MPFRGPASRAHRILAQPGRIVGVVEGPLVATGWTGKGDGVAAGELESQVTHLLPEWAKTAFDSHATTPWNGVGDIGGDDQAIRGRGMREIAFAVDTITNRLLRFATNAPRKINMLELPMPAWK